MVIRKNTLLVLAILLALSSLGFGYDIYWSTPISVSSTISGPGTRTFTGDFKLNGGPVENLNVIAKIDGVQVFEKNYASIPKDVTRKITFDNYIGIGKHTVQFIIDPNNTTSDTNQGNNVTEKEFIILLNTKNQILMIAPDISVNNITVNSQSIHENKDFTVTFEYKNTGLIKIKGGPEFQLKVDGIVVKTWIMILPLEPGQARTLSHTFSIGSDGTKQLTVVLDSTNKLKETSELNNTKSITINVHKALMEILGE